MKVNARKLASAFIVLEIAQCADAPTQSSAADVAEPDILSVPEKVSR